MEYLKWLELVDQESQGRYIEVTCPYFKNRQCAIYEKRFACCRNFPQLKGYCSRDKKCQVIKNKIENHTSKLRVACNKCQKACCEKILVPINVKITKAFIEKWMNISCEDCRDFFK